MNTEPTAESDQVAAWIIKGSIGCYGSLFLMPYGSLQRGGAGGVARSEARVFTDRAEASALLDALNRSNPERKTFALVPVSPPQEPLWTADVDVDVDPEFAKALALIKEKKAIRYEGVLGPIVFDQWGDVTGPFLVMKVNAEGKIAPQGAVISKDEIDKLMK